MEPLVSIILPVQNAGTYLPACLDSLLRQKHQRIEVIAIDDFSKDASVKVLRQYRKLDKRIKVFTNVKRYGLAITLNRALRRAQGEFVTFMNPHDVNSVWRIKRQIDFLTQNPKVVAVGTQAVTINEKGRPIERKSLPVEHDHIYRSFFQGLSVQLESLMINKRLIPRDLLYFKPNKYPYIYIDTFMKLFHYGKFANLVQHLYYHRGKQISEAKVTRKDKVSQGIQLFLKQISIDYRTQLRLLLSPTIKGALNR